MDLASRIVINPAVSLGKPCIRGTRITVESILELLSARWTYEQIQEEYDLKLEDILAVLDYARRIIEEEKVYKVYAETGELESK